MRPLTLALFAILAFCVWFFLWYPEVALQSQKRIERDRHSRIAVDIQALHARLESYKIQNGVYPTTKQGLAMLGTQPSDPWNDYYVYRCPGLHNRSGYDLFSCGADRKPDTPDDDWGE